MAETPHESILVEITALGKSLVEFGETIARDTRTDVVDHEPAAAPTLPNPAPHFENAQLLTEHTEGWHVPHPWSLAAPSYAPAMTAFGIVFIALGAVTVWPLSVIGALIFILAIAKWIGELLHD